jgi:hypothetical protein
VNRTSRCPALPGSPSSPRHPRSSVVLRVASRTSGTLPDAHFLAVTITERPSVLATHHSRPVSEGTTDHRHRAPPAGRGVRHARRAQPASHRPRVPACAAHRGLGSSKAQDSTGGDKARDAPRLVILIETPHRSPLHNPGDPAIPPCGMDNPGPGGSRCRAAPAGAVDGSIRLAVPAAQPARVGRAASDGVTMPTRPNGHRWRRQGPRRAGRCSALTGTLSVSAR